MQTGRGTPCWLALAVAGSSALLVGPVYGQPIGSSSNVGYIDNAIPTTQFRLRFETADDINRPDRAEFLYPRGATGQIYYQNVATYFEWAASDRLSGFLELNPGYFVHPQLASDTAGFGDMNAGFKWALRATDDQVVSFEFRTYIPTGNPNRDLGTGHVSLEPSLLFYQQLTDRLTLEGEFRDWIPATDADFAGNVLRYGAGLGYEAFETPRLRVCPVAEFIGWTVLSGRESLFVPQGPEPASIPSRDAAGDTIVNVKLGVRLKSCDHGDLYIGYGRALTGDVWYKDVLRVEYRLAF